MLVFPARQLAPFTAKAEMAAVVVQRETGGGASGKPRAL
jgi:hypothetical protein